MLSHVLGAGVQLGGLLALQLQSWPRRACAVRLRSAEGALLLTMEEARSRAGEKPQQIGNVSSATYLSKLFIGYV